MKKSLILFVALLFGFGLVFSSCVTTDSQVKPNENNFMAPKVTLDSFMVPQYDGYWYFSKKAKPTKGDAGDRGAMLPMSFLFNIENRNPYPILLNGMTFTVVVDKEFELVTYNNDDEYWIPAGMTDQVRATTLITVRSALLSLLVTGGFKLKAKGVSPWKALEDWWKGVPEGTTPVNLTGCSFSFSAGGVSKVYPYEMVAQ
jgi:archaellum component FlaF (FlaF/FlaG flagellin family)